MRVCPTCGAQNDADARFCGVCGSAIPVAPRPIEARQPSRGVPPRPRPESQPGPVGGASGTIGVAATLEPASVGVEPGGSAKAQVRIVNLSRVVDEYRVDVIGEAAAWTTVEPPSISLFPGATGTVDLVFRPPKTVQARAGTLPLAVNVRSQADPAKAVFSQGLLRIGAFDAMSAAIVPRTSTGQRSASHDLTIENQGNSSIQIGITASDPDRKLLFRVATPAITLDPAQRTVVRVDVQAVTDLRGGSPVTMPFEVVATPDRGTPATAAASFVQTPLRPPRIGRALAVAAAVVAALIVAVVGAQLLSRPAATSPGVPTAAVVAGSAPGNGSVTPRGPVTVTTAPANVTAVPITAPPVTAAPVTQPAMVTVPELVGQPESAVVGKLTDAGLVAGQRTEVPDSNISLGVVVRTVPPVGTQVAKGSAVDYVVSLGPPTPSPTVTPSPTPSPTPTLVPLACDNRPADQLTLTLSPEHKVWTVPPGTLACLGQIAFYPAGPVTDPIQIGITVASDNGYNVATEAPAVFAQPGIAPTASGSTELQAGQRIFWQADCPCPGYRALIPFVLHAGNGLAPASVAGSQAFSAGAPFQSDLDGDHGAPDLISDGTQLRGANGPLLDLGFDPAGYAACWALLPTARSEPVPISALVVGTSLCLMTDKGSIVSLTVAEADRMEVSKYSP